MTDTQTQSFKCVVIGLDGFDPLLATRWMEAGKLPVLNSLRKSGVYSPLRSTIPPVTYPAWSTFLTGSNPGKHGIIDFALRRYNSYDIEFINSTYRRLPTFLDLLNSAGFQVGAMGIPATYPPDRLNGFMISGFDSPIAVNADPTFCHPPELYHELKQKIHPYTLAGIQEIRIHSRWHEKTAKQLLESVQKRAEIACYLIRSYRFPIHVFVFSEADTASHHFWVFHDRESPRRLTSSDRHSDVILRTYQALDDAVGAVINAAGSAATVIVLSDHGFGGTGARALSINRLLETLGFFRYRDRSRRPDIRTHPIRWIPTGIQQMLFRKFKARIPAWFEARNRISFADLKHCAAFSDELNYFPSIWIHDSRFPVGRRLDPVDRKKLVDSIIRSLPEIRNPNTGVEIIRRAHRREELYSGPAVDRIPDIILELNCDLDYSYPILRARTSGPILIDLPQSEMTGSKGKSMNGSHRSHGVLYVSGPEIRNRETPKDPGIEDVAPTILALARVAVPGFMNGRILEEILTPEITAGIYPDTRSRNAHSTGQPEPYGSRESDAVRKRLEDLGYL
ncbi:alkaline phosphatase family protein [bacterium]|nr:alkaline phosphatase family protein [candidate division CSSED10-310 bacterium]